MGLEAHLMPHPLFLLRAIGLALLASPAWAQTSLPQPASVPAPAASSAVTTPIFTTLAVSPIFPPRPVRASDGLTHHAYELSLVNMTSLVVGVDRLSVLDADTGEVLADWSGDTFKALFRLNGHDPAETFAPAQSGLFFVDVALPTGTAEPRALAHRLSTTRLMKVPGNDSHKGRPLDPAIALPEKITFTTTAVVVDDRPVVRLAPPLRGAGWVVGNGCCNSVTSHRGAAMAFNGSVEVPERFAIDFVQIGSNGAFFEGPENEVGSYRYYGVPVHAAAAGTVVGIADGMEEGVQAASGPASTPKTPRAITSWSTWGRATSRSTPI